MSHLNYPYSQGNRLEERNTYFYSEYRGVTFLSEWTASRQHCLSQLPKSMPLKWPRIQDSVSTGSYETSALLARLLSADKEDIPSKKLAERLLQRFEVSKRIYRRYDNNLKAIVDSGFDTLELYLQFASLCLYHAKAANSLQFLNGLIKCIDTLVSVQTQLSLKQGANLAWLIRAELECVTLVANRAGVMLGNENS